MGRKLPVLFNKKEECCGCTACYAICPQSAIMMIEDEEGFEYPKVDETKCLGCYICLEVCPMKVIGGSRHTGQMAPPYQNIH